MLSFNRILFTILFTNPNSIYWIYLNRGKKIEHYNISTKLFNRASTKNRRKQNNSIKIQKIRNYAIRNTIRDVTKMENEITENI